ncbi:MAG: hypothetical protein NXH70_02015 [Hyphomonas sp.]|nr:hypothetical protein [Hyphomonas sp.]
MNRVECEFCAGELSEDLVCEQADCGADMQTHWEMTNPDKLFTSIQVHLDKESKPRPSFGNAEFELVLAASNT